MHPQYYKELIPIRSHTKQLLREVESLTADPNGDDETLRRVSKQLAEMRAVLAEVKRKLEQVEC